MADAERTAEDIGIEAERIWSEGTDAERADLVRATTQLLETLAPKLDTLADTLGALALVLRVAGLRQNVAQQMADTAAPRPVETMSDMSNVFARPKEQIMVEGARVEVTNTSSQYFGDRGKVVRMTDDITMVRLDTNTTIAFHPQEIRVVAEGDEDED